MSFDPYRHIARNVVLPLWGIREKNPYLKYIPEHLRYEKLPIEQLRELQFERLSNILHHAYENTAYYKSVFDSLGMRPSDIKCFEDIQVLPVLTKDIIRARLEEFVPRNVPQHNLLRTQTGGSTGVPMTFYRDRRCTSLRNAATACFNRWVGYQPGDKRALLWGAAQDLYSAVGLKGKVRSALIDRAIVLNVRDLSLETAISFARAIDEFKPVMLSSYPIALDTFAKLLKANGIKPPTMPKVITTADLLRPEQRQFIQEFLSCEIFDRYGSREMGEIAMECGEHNGFHLDLQSHFVEIVKEGKQVENGELGQIAVTDLVNYGMPFIRYLHGDLAMMSNRKCPCGNSSPMIESIQGRLLDIVVTPAGRIVLGPMFVIWFTCLAEEVRQLQFIQENTNTIRVRVAGNDSDKVKNLITDIIKEKVSPDMVVKFDMVESIPSEPSGKYRYIVSKLSQDEIDRAFNSNS